MCKISIVVPIHNSQKTLERCINSILSQSFKDFELILIDDGSSDLSYEICRKFAEKDKRISCILGECRGVSYSRNIGIDMAKGEYIGFVDSDDYIDSDMLEFMYNSILKTQSEIVLCGYKIEYGKTVVINNCKDMIITGGVYGDDFITLKSKHLIDSVWNKLYNLEFLRNTGVKMPVNEIYEDTAFNLELLKFKPKIAVKSRCFYHYVQNMGSITKQYNPQKLEFMKKRARQLREVTSGIEGYCGFFYIKSVYSAIIDMFLSCGKKEIRHTVKDIVKSDEFIQNANDANFLGLKNKIIIYISRSRSEVLIYAL
ncbi:MAG: glycosyltransferase family 2 protein, partial [Clostridia bacterium]|nr:glycosyltransferase family 2 protein [Clostridia bacterium]